MGKWSVHLYLWLLERNNNLKTSDNNKDKASGGWTRFAKHDGAIDRFVLSCNEPSYYADLEEQKKFNYKLEVTKVEVSPFLVV